MGMSWKNWWRGRRVSREVAPEAGETGPSVPPSPATELPAWPPLVLEREDVQTALLHHLAWCELFNRQLMGIHDPAQQLKPLPLVHESELGQWISRKGQEGLAMHPQWKELRASHEDLHRVARQVLGHLAERRIDMAATLLNTNYERCRLQVMVQLKRLHA
jgi:Chemoreceptor zinc-binding domain